MKKERMRMRVEFDIENPKGFIKQYGDKMKFADNEPYCQYSAFLESTHLTEGEARSFGLFCGSGDIMYISADTPFTIIDVYERDLPDDADLNLHIRLEAIGKILDLRWKLNNPFDVRL